MGSRGRGDVNRRQGKGPGGGGRAAGGTDRRGREQGGGRRSGGDCSGGGGVAQGGQLWVMGRMTLEKRERGRLRVIEAEKMG